MPAERSYDIESALVEEDLEFQRRQWNVQRVGWWFVVAVPVTALVGFCGGGIVSSRSINVEGVRIEYEGFARRLGNSDLQVAAGASEPNADTIVLRLDRDYVDIMHPTAYAPPPRRIDSTDHYTDFIFPRAPGSSPTRIHLELHPERWGKAVGTIRIDGSEPVELHTFVWP